MGGIWMGAGWPFTFPDPIINDNFISIMYFTSGNRSLSQLYDAAYEETLYKTSRTAYPPYTHKRRKTEELNHERVLER